MLKLAKDWLLQVTSIVGTLTGGFYFLSGESIDPIKALSSLVLLSAALAFFGHQMFRKSATRRPRRTLELPEETVEELKKDDCDSLRQLRFWWLTPAFLPLFIVVFLVTAGKSILSPADVTGFATIGGMQSCYGYTDNRPYWSYRPMDLEHPFDTGVAGVDMAVQQIIDIENGGHGVEFYLEKRSTTRGDVLVSSIVVEIIESHPCPKVKQPYGGAGAGIEPNIFIANFAEVGEGTSEIAYYYEENSDGTLVQSQKQVLLNEGKTRFQVRVNSTEEALLRFRVTANLDAGWRSRVIEIGTTLECLFVHPQHIETKDPDDDLVYDVLTKFGRWGDGREVSQRRLEEAWRQLSGLEPLVDEQVTGWKKWIEEQEATPIPQTPSVAPTSDEDIDTGAIPQTLLPPAPGPPSDPS